MRYFKILILFVLVVAMSGCAGSVALDAFGYGVSAEWKAEKTTDSEASK